MTDDQTREPGADAFRRGELDARRQDGGDSPAIAPVIAAPGEAAPRMDKPEQLDTGVIPADRAAAHFRRGEMTAERERRAPGNRPGGGEK